MLIDELTPVGFFGSEWDRIVKDTMTTAAAIDRLVHHSVILEMTGSSIRIEEAQAGRSNEGGNEPDPTTTTGTSPDQSTPGAAPTAPGPTTTTSTPTTATTATTATTTTPTQGGSTSDRRDQLKKRVQQRRTEADGEM